MRSRARRTCAVVLTTLLVLLAAPLLPAAAAEDPDLAVRITGLTPTRLTERSTVVMAGTITNRGERTWTKAQAYLVIPRTPFTTRQQVQDALTDGRSYTGERVVDLAAIDELGTLAPGRTVRFRIRVPYRSLGTTGAQGVYPVGVQVLATGEDGTRGSDAIARATTFLPRVDGDGAAESTPSAVVWPFVMPDRRGADGRWRDPGATLARVSGDGQLRHLLDHALAAPAQGTTVLLDPALLVGLRDIVDDRRMPEDLEPTDAQRTAARTFLDDLVRLSRTATCWVLGYQRPDVLAVAGSPDRSALTAALDRATSSVLAEFGVSGRRVSWPTRTGTTDTLVQRLRGNGETPVIVSRQSVPDWEPRLGSVVARPTPAGPVPLLVNNALDTELPGEATVATLRQRLLGEAALGSLERTADGGSRADAVVLLDPDWDPGPVGTASWLDAVFGAPFTEPAGLDDLMAMRLPSYTGEIPRSADASPLGREQVGAVADAVARRDVLATLVPDSGELEDAGARAAAEALSVRWRSHRREGLAVARAVSADAERQLASIEVEAPPAVTLSSAEGTFPLTIRNGSTHPVRVGVRLSSSNAGLAVDDVAPVEVAAGERRTVTVTTDVGSLDSSTFTAQMVTADGEEVGEPDVFNVRSSRVGVAVWVAMGVAALFVAAALARRFVRRRGGSEVVQADG